MKISQLVIITLATTLPACSLTASKTIPNQADSTTINSPTPMATTQTSPQLVGNDADEHGCLGSAGYSWCELKNKCLRTWEEPCAPADQTEDISASIKVALVAKYNWDPATVKFTLHKTVEDKYASGGVNFIGADAGGGYVFAAKVNDKWQIVADGNGIIECSSLKPYPDFPTSLIPECYNSTTGKTQKR